MANKRDGGTIIIGVSQTAGVFSTDGMEAAHIVTYDEDTISAYINSYADPYVTIQKHEKVVNGKTFLALVVYEFEDVPVICERDSGTELREGAVYCRSYRMPETTEVRSQTEMREIVDMAIEKGLRNYLQTSRRIGVPLEEISRRAQTREYDNELGGL
jgi:predicted HTH transcriptional regulator